MVVALVFAVKSRTTIGTAHRSMKQHLPEPQAQALRASARAELEQGQHAHSDSVVFNPMSPLGLIGRELMRGADSKRRLTVWQTF